MSIKYRWIVAISIVLVLGPLQVLAELTMGVFPRRTISESYKMYKPLAQYLSKKLDQKVELVLSKDFKEFWANVKLRKFDLVHYNQYHYIKSHKELGYHVFAINEEFGNSSLSSVIVVRKDSNVKTIEDLRGRTVLFGGGKKAMLSYIAPTAILKRAGLIAGKDYTEKFTKNPLSAALGIYHNAAGAAGFGHVVLENKSIMKKINVNQLEIIFKDKPLTHLPWATSENVSNKVVEDIQLIMTSLSNTSEGKKILKMAKVSNFLKVVDSDFNDVRKITEYAIGETYFDD